MQAAIAVVRKPAVREDRVIDSVTLDHAARRDHHRDVTTDKGATIHVHLHDVASLRDGDALKLDNDALVRVRAAAENLYEMRSDNAARLARLAWHFGSNHVAMEATAEALYVAADPGLDELIRGQGVTFAKVSRPFEPERDAHHHHHHGHDHHHDHHHDHGHKHERDHHAHEHHHDAHRDHAHDHGHKHR